MKKILIIAGFLGLVTACTNDEDLFDPLGGGSDATLVGSWKLTSMLVETPIDVNGDGVSGTDFLVESNCYQNETLVFNADFTGLNVSTSYLQMSVTGSFPENVTVNTECIEEDDTSDFAWLQNDTTVTFMDETGSFTGTLENNVLSIVIPDGQIYMDDEFNVVLMEDLTLVYTKQP